MKGKILNMTENYKNHNRLLLGVAYSFVSALSPGDLLQEKEK
jgi:hypothetical protein